MSTTFAPPPNFTSCRLDVAMPTPAHQLALEEWLLDSVDQRPRGKAWLRVWEANTLGVVVGRSSRTQREARLDVCRASGVPVLRRISGGAAVVVGPGCLMYAIVVDLRAHPLFRVPDAAHGFFLDTMAASLQCVLRHPDRLAGYEIARQGISDLAIRGPDRVWRKVSGNSVRVKRNALLYHGTLLYEFPLETIERLLHRAPHEPEYRGDRPHADFVTNLPLDLEEDGASLETRLAVVSEETTPRKPGALLLQEALSAAWRAEAVEGPLAIDREAVERLAVSRYGSEIWNHEGRWDAAS